MIPFAKGVGRKLGLGSARAADFLAGGSKRANKINELAAKRVTQARAAGMTGPQAAKHNVAIRMRQMQLGKMYGGMAVGGGILASQGKSKSSYNPQRPNTQTARGTGRYA